MTATKPRDLLAILLVVGIVANLLVRLTYGTLPGFPLFAGATFGVLAVAETIAAFAFRSRIRHDPGSRPVQPLVAARAVLVAKASSVAGAVLGGCWLGLLSYVAPRAGRDHRGRRRHRVRGGGAGVRAGARRRRALVGALPARTG